MNSSAPLPSHHSTIPPFHFSSPSSSPLIGQYPDATGHFGPYGGRFVGETLMSALLDVEAAWTSAKNDPDFLASFRAMLRDYAGRPTPLDLAERLSDALGGVAVGHLVVQAAARASAHLFRANGAAVGPHSLSLAAACTYGGALLAAIWPILRATRVRPMDALAPRSDAPARRLSPPLVALGLLLLAVHPLVTFAIPMPDSARYAAYVLVGCPAFGLAFILLAGGCGAGLSQYVSFFAGLHLQLILEWRPILAGLGAALLLCALAAVGPALSIARTDPLSLLQQGRGSF